MMRVTSRINELAGLYAEIHWLPELDEKRDDETVVELMQEYQDLVKVKSDVDTFLGIT